MITYTVTITVTHDDEFAKDIRETLSKDEEWRLIDEDTSFYTYRKMKCFELVRKKTDE